MNHLIRNIIRTIVPPKLRDIYWWMIKKRKYLKAKALYGSEPKNFCPICQKYDYFLSYTPRKTANTKVHCPNCLSAERHRLLWIFYQNHTDLFTQLHDVLHIAAETCFSKRFEDFHGKRYITADLNNPRAMVKMDITAINYPDESFDIVLCNHVLEHVLDDIKAMSELFRILRKNGLAIITVPLFPEAKTFEDKTIVSEEDRLKFFGSKSHVRRYGQDICERLQSVGFEVKIFNFKDITSEDNFENMRLLSDETKEIIYCKK
ncbi:MAG: class I SAM-dependent methyltransferase [Candidatus Cloacimonetes bacterium]|nr:class I SAM-dependent methyltransferase [Candidatus Cloacimonadota bacterium]